jgi:dihydrofolate reductase
VEKRWGHLEWRMRRAGSEVVEKDRHLFSAAVVVLLHHRG